MPYHVGPGKEYRRGGAIDTDPSVLKCELGKGCTIYYKDTVPVGTDNKDGSNDGSNVTDAKLSDSPTFNTFTAETCARCAEKGNEAWLGCFKWGYRNGTEIAPRVSDGPSPTFDAALQSYNKYWGN
jgi:hypothetical protein